MFQLLKGNLQGAYLIHCNKFNKMTHQMYPKTLLANTFNVTSRVLNLVTRYVEPAAGMYQIYSLMMNVLRVETRYNEVWC